MESTNEKFILSRNVIKVVNKKNTFLEFVKFHKVFIIITTIFLSLIILDLILLDQFIKLLLTL